MKAGRIFSYIILGIISLVFLNAGISKILGQDRVIDILQQMNMPYWFIILLGITELLLVVGLWVWEGKLRPLVLTIMFGMISGAIAASIAISLDAGTILLLIFVDLLIFATIGIDQRFFVFIEELLD